MEFEKWLEKSNTRKMYAHFDSKAITIKTVIDEIKHKNNIVTHSFMPFIHRTLKFKRFTPEKKIKIKNRELYYSSHYDRCIYQYYSYLLNEHYNQKTKEYKISDVAIAYRNNFDKKSNINFAKQAFDFIREKSNCLIIVGDFEKFFDNLNHKYLKERICSLLNEKTLPLDYYKIYKFLTKFSYVNFLDILNYFHLENTTANGKKLNDKPIIMPIKTLREVNKTREKNEALIKTNTNNYGIPQGSAISAVLSNIYMLEFDKCVNDYISNHNGLYLRYSDDSMFVIPLKTQTESEIINHYDNITKFIKAIPNLILQPDKTHIYIYNSSNLQNIDNILGLNKSKDIIDYLGFSFNGKVISLRDKTISKYYYRAYKKAKTIVRIKSKNPTKKISCKKLYSIYTLKGAHIGKGNFLTYVKRCTNIFGKNEKVTSILNKHYGKLKKFLTQHKNKS